MRDGYFGSDLHGKDIYYSLDKPWEVCVALSLIKDVGIKDKIHLYLYAFLHYTKFRVKNFLYWKLR